MATLKEMSPVDMSRRLATPPRDVDVWSMAARDELLPDELSQSTGRVDVDAVLRRVRAREHDMRVDIRDVRVEYARLVKRHEDLHRYCEILERHVARLERVLTLRFRPCSGGDC